MLAEQQAILIQCSKKTFQGSCDGTKDVALLKSENQTQNSDGNQNFTTTSSVTTEHTETFRNTSSIIPKGGKKTNFIQNDYGVLNVV